MRETNPDPQAPVRVLICDDQWVVRLGLRTNLEQWPETQVVGEAANGNEAVEKASKLRPEVVLMDLEMPEKDGATATAEIVEAMPGTKVVVFSQYDAASDVLRAVEAGATGFVFKYDSAEDLRGALREVATGGALLASKAALRLLEQIKGGPDVLTPREVEVLQLVSEGLKAVAIGNRLQIKESTVKGHLTSLFEKLNAQDRTSAVVEAYRRGIIRL